MYTFKAEQKLPVSLKEAWDFISEPYNLLKITPGSVKMRILSDIKPGEKVFQGQVIEYELMHLPGITTKWVSEISEVHDMYYFIDIQRKGPFRSWEHKHLLRTEGDAVIMEDTVHYSIPLGIIGRFAHALFVRKKLENVFKHRCAVFESVLGKA